ncbi:VOC family protein [Mucilaginibacter sp. RS28]|uniref:VOC family protein n=1 Tax=Mucilaginibacter straminoryzae TaxID=2932774 RepID=A0A9X1X7K2_9SPHI|nr:VOC family protein [Mucilaginibacter straminoryzae]MCJ8212001.1 VOC family protein [Mucilaginibacter straminoryzae]
MKNLARVLLSISIPVCASFNSFAQSVSVIDHIAICVKDLKKSTDFYTRIMHFEKVADPFNDHMHQWYNIGKGVKMHAIQGDCQLQHQIADHLCFAVNSVKEFADELKKNNIPYRNWKGDSTEPTLRADGVLQLYFQDPDGYWIEINSPAPKK